MLRKANLIQLDSEALSADGQALLIDLFDCTGGADGGTVPAASDLSTSQAAILEQIKTTLAAQGLTLDEACLEDLIAGLDSAAIAAQDQEVLTELGAKAAVCVQQP